MKSRKEIFAKYKVEGIQDIGIIFQEKLNIEEEIRKIEEKIAKIDEQRERENYIKKQKGSYILWDEDKEEDYGVFVSPDYKTEFSLLRGNYVEDDCESGPRIKTLLVEQEGCELKTKKQNL